MVEPLQLRKEESVHLLKYLLQDKAAWKVLSPYPANVENRASS